MGLFIERIHTPGIAAISYLVGDEANGKAAVIDPRPDVDVYLEAARKRGVVITHIFETHIHADFVSGSRELANRCEGAVIGASVEGGQANYGFDVEALRDGDRFEWGSLSLVARHTPGHTPEHVAYEAYEGDSTDPFAVFTGDSLFVGSAGRPDLLGDDAEELAGQLYETLFEYFAELPDGVILYPAHGSGSPCGAGIGDRMESTVGYEKRHNAYLETRDRDAFVRFALDGARPSRLTTSG